VPSPSAELPPSIVPEPENREAVEDQLAAMAGIDEAVDEGAPPLVAGLETVPALGQRDIAEELVVGVDAAARVAGGRADGAV
jgi:hypothetical protein